MLVDVIGDGWDGDDCTGHGTHMAGIIGGNTYGVAKEVALVAVRVLDCTGVGSSEGIAAGLDSISANHVNPSVANMSIWSQPDSVIDYAVWNLVANGVTVVTIAGNAGQDACDFSPARVPEAITVGASTESDGRLTQSNWGGCVDIFAPGENITSAWHTSNSATHTDPGSTSTAAPHVAGVVATYRGEHPSFSPPVVFDSILANATEGELSGIGSGSPNLLIYSMPPDFDPLMVQIDGPTHLTEPKQYQWSSMVSGGEGPPSYDYLWEIQYVQFGGWSPVGTGSQVQFSVDESDGDFYLRLTVTSGEQSENDQIYVTNSIGCDQFIC